MSLISMLRIHMKPLYPKANPELKAILRIPPIIFSETLEFLFPKATKSLNALLKSSL